MLADPKQQPMHWLDGDEYDPVLKLELQVPYAGRRHELALRWDPDEKSRPLLLTIGPVPPGSDGGWETHVRLSHDDIRVLREFLTMMLALSA